MHLADKVGPSGQRARDIEKNVFLNLLVAQIRNQNPLNPTDGSHAQLPQIQYSNRAGAIRPSPRLSLPKPL
ncbi:MAG: hypothetical protein DMG58_27770 [Acidobacteria bacterium]|nr:MAG: hypothetical protein DMG58_27770 [Acidobacteriota bacterium]